MFQTPYFFLFLVVIVLWGILNQLALLFYWYWIFWWFDILMHVLGGFIVVLGGLIVYISSPLIDRLFLRRRPLLAAFIGAVGVGLLWELFEVYTDIIDLPAYLLDSALDILAGLAGGLIAYVLIMRHRRRNMR